MFADWESVGMLLGVIASALAILRGLWVLVPKLCRKLGQRVSEMFGIGDIKTDIGALTEQVKFVVDELKPNGGASIRDSLNRIEIRQVLQEQRQKAILSDMSVGVFETDTDGEFIWVNRKYLRMTGRTPNEVTGSGWINTIAERDRERVTAEWKSAMDASREFESSYLMITPDDERVEVSVRTYKYEKSDDPENPLGFMGIVTPLCSKGAHL